MRKTRTMNMKIRTFLSSGLALALTAAFSAGAAETTRLNARSGSTLTVYGTSNIHDWQVRCHLIIGNIEVGPNFPTKPGQQVTPGKVEASGHAWVIVRSLKSINKDGSPYEASMDNVMYDHLKADNNRLINYYLTGLVLKQVPKDKNSPYLFDSTGKLVVAGVTNTISMPIQVLPLGNAMHEIKISGVANLKMTDFGVVPPAPKLMIFIHTADPVKVVFDWMVAPPRRIK
jgi:hypothetical protein